MSAIAYVVAVVTASILLTVAGSGSGGDTKPGGESLEALADFAAQRVQIADAVAAAKWGTDARQHVKQARALDPTHDDALGRALASMCHKGTGKSRLGAGPPSTGGATSLPAAPALRTGNHQCYCLQVGNEISTCCGASVPGSVCSAPRRLRRCCMRPCR